jgi:TonB family protein
MESGNHEVARQAPVLSSGQLLAELQAKIRAEKAGSDAMLHQIVEAARILTRAHGAALAMRQNHAVICMATAGGMAPALGSELQVDSGISGQCLRTGAPLCCDDTSTDPRVDQEVCGRLGLGSLAVAPVGKWPAVGGILEVFSAMPHAFKDAEVELLAELADLVEIPPSTWTTQPTESDDSEKIVPPQAQSTSSIISAGLRLAGATWKWSNGKLILAAVICMFVVWLGLRGRAARPNASAAAPQPRTTLAASPVAVSSPAVAEAPSSTPPANTLRPSPVVARNTKASVPARGSTASTTQGTEPSEAAIQADPPPEAAALANTPAPAENPTSPPPQQATVDVSTAPALDVTSADGNATIKGVLSSVTGSPVLPGLKASTGVSGGIVERQVKPIYPAEALRLKREGRVVLGAVITKEGTVRDLKVITGDALLARAAMDAVAAWRYQPYMLNGEPVQRTTEITIVFKLP